MKDVKEMTTAELIAEYNHLTGKKITRFASRAAGEKQVLSARAVADVKSMFKGGTTTGALPASEGKRAEKKEAKPKAAAKPKAEKKAAKPKAEPGKISVARSKGISDSWNDPAIAAKRAQRNGAQVAGEKYRSVKAAFLALKLPLEKHIAFRMSLKESGKETFERNGKKYNFVLTE